MEKDEKLINKVALENLDNERSGKIVIMSLLKKERWTEDVIEFL